MIPRVASGAGSAGRLSSMLPLNDPCYRLLQAIVSAPLAWQAPTQLAVQLGLALDDISDTIADLDAAGWLDPWEMGDAMFVTLSPSGAERMRVRLVMIGRSDAMRWSSIDEPEPEPPRVSGRHQGLSSLDFIADPNPGPEEAAEAAERALRLARQKADAGDGNSMDMLPRPRFLVGSGLTPWPGPTRQPANPCPACGSRPLAESAYCLVCDRWGLDHLMTSQKMRKPASRPTRNPVNPSTNPSAPKAARKEKRRRRWARALLQERATKGRH